MSDEDRLAGGTVPTREPLCMKEMFGGIVRWCLTNVVQGSCAVQGSCVKL